MSYAKNLCRQLLICFSRHYLHPYISANLKSLMKHNLNISHTNPHINIDTLENIQDKINIFHHHTSIVECIKGKHGYSEFTSKQSILNPRQHSSHFFILQEQCSFCKIHPSNIFRIAVVIKEKGLTFKPSSSNQ